MYNLFLEYLAGGALSDHIKKQGGSLDENAVRFNARQILLGLNYLHLKGLVHCDIKGQNILIGGDGLKIADFGCAKWAVSGCSVSPEFSGTPAYMAPEVARGEEQSFPADIWALGCTVIEMATGSNPWPEMKDPASALYRIAFSGDVPAIPNWFSGDARDFLSKCLMRESRERCTAAELLQHRFFDCVEENCGENIREFTRKSPTSVMDQDIWDALDLSDSCPNPTELDSSSDSPVGRIRALTGDELSFGGWVEEEDWLTVRGIEIEECLKVDEPTENVNQDSEELMDTELESLFLSIDEDEEEDILNSISMENSLFDCFSTFPVKNVKDFSVFTIINFERIMLMELFLHQDQLFPTTLVLFFLFYHLNTIRYCSNFSWPDLKGKTKIKLIYRFSTCK